MKSLAELAAIRDKMKQNTTIREDGEKAIRIVVGMATCGIAAGARPVLNAITAELAKENINHVTVAQTGCIGRCTLEPIIDVIVPGEEPVTYVHVTPDKIPKIIKSHVINDVPVMEYTVAAYEN
ncbi:MAG: (2Fe-2S) ferredoxin domain-containing protein [Oscillospiraceae bacterium]|jgi:NADP-reducing hydrogenase subunit HndB|nr:(2Fe-2S) ferredoxin domain-containing protein [Oscillospiraceae bacterium]